MNAYANRRFAHKQPVYIEFRQQINISKNPQPCRPLVKGGGFSLEKLEGLTLVRKSDLQANLQPNIVYKQNVFQSLSQLPLTALFTKERADYNNKCNSKKIDFISTEV